MRSVAAAGIVVPEPRVVSRVIGAGCELTGDFAAGMLEAGVFETGVVLELEAGTGADVEFCAAGWDMGACGRGAEGAGRVALAWELGADATGADVPCTAFVGCIRYQAPPATSKTAAAIPP